MTVLAKSALKIAQSQNGVKEVPRGSNAGPEVEIYLKSVGLGKGYPWCMALVFWAVSQAAKNMKVANPLIKTGGVMRQWNEIPTKFKVKSDPQPGDIFIMDFGKGAGHTGFIVEVLPNGKVKTFEGNTNDDGSREGNEACYKTRPLTAFKGFIRI